MTITNWFNWSVKDLSNESHARPKLIPGFDQLDKRLQAALQERDLHQRKRKQAGGGQSQAKPKKLRKQTPRVCKFQKVYSEKRKELKREANMLSNAFQFRSRPVPDFERSHRRLERRRLYLNSLQTVTKPLCPGTLATSMVALNKRLKEQRQCRKASDFVPRINPGSSMDYLNRQPFTPRVKSSFTHPKPFHLHTSERALRRQMYDERKRIRMDRRLEQQTLDWYARERSEFCKLRKMTNFKATPNPWKQTRVSARKDSHGA
ncbi:uncharacterized protein LOC6732120 [Drosophila simulans]|uniref:GD22103 n=1 Tax=Drosophila simulans TaxID=7240 RepID=B4Q487_DROSI|nr:uncharacterized protein LOC6732120 [Drosophila simulans]EDX04837.1 GD22103 [Drosophila simulans]KMY89953.1 uncharacterized protein Dsimw501_GD22103 [Drosophila simulans]